MYHTLHVFHTYYDDDWINMNKLIMRSINYLHLITKLNLIDRIFFLLIFFFCVVPYHIDDIILF